MMIGWHFAELLSDILQLCLLQFSDISLPVAHITIVPLDLHNMTKLKLHFCDICSEHSSQIFSPTVSFPISPPDFTPNACRTVSYLQSTRVILHRQI
jgi:hypothetical protein